MKSSLILLVWLLVFPAIHFVVTLDTPSMTGDGSGIAATMFNLIARGPLVILVAIALTILILNINFKE